jgi:succinate-semialdehyde dehydrogenase / glutarate-semialdehyde dehydrogenase
MSLISTNPATEKTIKKFKADNKNKILEKIELAYKTFDEMKSLSIEERAYHMKKVSELLMEDKNKYGKIITEEMGKPISQAIAEVEKCAWVCDYYANQAADFLKPEKIKTDASESYVRFDPLGVILAVMPWNYPFWQVFRFAAPTLMGGNSALLKHASNVSGSALAIQDLFLKAGFPIGAMQSLLVNSSEVEAIINNDKVAAVTLTGSEFAGSAVASAAGKALKKTVLELGGSDPFIVLEDVDIDEVAAMAANARLQNNGQSCIAAKRFIIVEDIYDDFLAAFKSEFESKKIGNPMDEKTEIGPLVSQKALDEIDLQVKKSVDEGAVIITGRKKT